MSDLKGKQFGRLVVIKRVSKNKWGNYQWLCKCNCDQKMITVVGGNLKNGHTKSCGCLRKETTIQRSTKHNHTKDNKKTKIYQIWKSIRQRCTNPKNKDYHNYGGRGITVCKRWANFSNFLKDVREHPDGYSIDRINNDQGYCKKNCKWSTAKQQARNRKDNHLETYGCKTRCLSEWSEETGIPQHIIQWRLKNGWSTKKTLTTPIKKRKKKHMEK